MPGDSGMPRWLIALAVGAPLTIALGYYYYRKKNVEEISDKNGSVKPKSIQTESDVSPTTPAPALPQTPLERVISLKNSGNEFFKNRKMDDAIKCYSEALSICPPEETDQMSVLYQNRAACYENLNDLDNLMKDINQSLELNPKYMKALTRRYKAAEKLQQYKQCVEDLTTLCILEKFTNIDTLTNVDRILKIIGALDSKEAASRRVPSIPSSHFIKSYFASFSEDPLINSVKSNPPTQTGDAPLFGLEAAKLALSEERYEDIISKCSEQITSDIATGNTNETYHQALLLRASLLILKTDYKRALEDIETIVNDQPDNVKITVNALVKRASLYLQLEDEVKCLQDFETAIALDPTNPDIYHHRGQIYMLLDKMDNSLEDFNTAHQYNPVSDLLAAQRLYTMYRHSVMKGRKSDATKAVEELKQVADKHKCVGGEAALLLAQIYLDQQDFDSAEKSFNKAMLDDPKNATILVHKGLLELQWHQDVNKAVEYMEKAIEVDPLLEFAYETLATVEVQRGQMERAIGLFDKALALSKGEREMAHICALKAAAETQLRMAQKLGLSALNLNQAF